MLDVSRILKYIKLTPFSLDTEQGRADERYRLALLSMSVNVFSKFMQMVVMIFTVSLTLPYLGPERFGIWMTISSFTAMLTFMDMGVGNALTNRVARVAAGNSDDEQHLTKVISGGVGVLAVITLVIVSLLIPISFFVPWHTLIKVNDYNLVKEIQSAMYVFCFFFGLSIFSGGVQKIFSGLQKAYIAHLANLVMAMCSLCVLFYSVSQKLGIVYLIISVLGVQSLSGFVLLFVLVKLKLLSAKKNSTLFGC